MPQPLPSKEQTLFKSLVKFYEGKQYKKGALYAIAAGRATDPSQASKQRSRSSENTPTMATHRR
jgi:hypothetical protein